jgi:hypothetical protein
MDSDLTLQAPLDDLYRLIEIVRRQSRFIEHIANGHYEGCAGNYAKIAGAREAQAAVAKIVLETQTKE